jgi:hypothetical protein
MERRTSCGDSRWPQREAIVAWLCVTFASKAARKFFDLLDERPDVVGFFAVSNKRQALNADGNSVRRR